MPRRPKTYLDGLKRAHEVAMGCLPIPCGNKKKMPALGSIMGIPIQAIEREIREVEGGKT